MLKYCSIGSGSSGNCHVVTYKDTGILVDAGLAGKTITSGIQQADFDIEKIRGIFITHEHSDHIKGAGIMSRKLDIPIYANLKTWCSMKDKIGNIRKNVKGSKLVVLESNYDPNMLMMGSYSYALKKRVMSEGGHLSNEEAASFCTELVEGGTESILLAHLSKENNFPELAYATSKNVLTKNNMIIGKDLILDVLSRDKVSKVYEL